MIVALVIWGLSFICYLVVAGTISFNELATAFALASLATLWAVIIRRSSVQRFAWRNDAIVPMLRALADLFPATLRTFARSARSLAAATAGRSPGHTVGTPFHFGARDDPRERSRRAIAVLFASMTPDRFVVRLEAERDAALVHHVGPPGGEPDARWLQ